MNKVLGSVFEVSLRVMLLLEVANPRMLSTEELAAFDYMSVYAKDFGFSDENLHGNGTYRFGEYASRRNLVQQAVKQLVLDRLITVNVLESGFSYSLNESGEEYCRQLQSDYSDWYRFYAESAIRSTQGKSELNLTKMITGRTLASLQRS